MVLRFEWDAAKNDANEQKHGVRFEEAKELFAAESSARASRVNESGLFTASIWNKGRDWHA